ncbi:ABC transporter ATP-binding protein [Fontibacillus sp. BL9]|uniref:ABC transporter ATP-binding protein n=1 Tax=Fontibacillus sp. BL9 TaxID=3389971 RepID=UPI003979DD57
MTVTKTTMAENLNTLIRIIPLLWRTSPGRLTLSCVCYAVLAFIPLAQIWIVKETVNSIMKIIEGHSELRMAYLFLFLQFILMIGSDAIQSLNEYTVVQLKQRAAYYIDEQIAIKASRLPLVFFDKPEYYDQLQRVSQGMAFRGLTVISTLMQLLQQTLTLVWFIIYLARIDVWFAIVMILLFLPSLVVNLKIGQRRYAQMMSQTVAERKSNYVMGLMTGRSAAKEMKLFRLTPYLLQKWKSLYWKNADEKAALTKQSESSRFWAQLIIILSNMIGVAYIVWMCSKGSLSLGDYVALSQTFITIQAVIHSATYNLSLMYEESLFLKELFLFLDFPEEQPEPEQLLAPFKLDHQIEVRNLCFSYPNSELERLRNISFNIQAGQTIAIVGENGAGKSTLAKCLVGLYQPCGGSVLFDGIPIDDIDNVSMKSNISAIFQDFVQYQFSIRENIGISHYEQMDNNPLIYSAAHKADIEQITSGSIHGLETELGPIFEGGQELSYGQWQKIALARAFFKDAPMMLLDEPTAAVDPISEAYFYERFAELARGKTTLMISHRLASCKIADHILVLKNGELIEQGDHDTLIALNGEYANMFDLQAQWYVNEHEEEQRLCSEA